MCVFQTSTQLPCVWLGKTPACALQVVARHPYRTHLASPTRIEYTASSYAAAYIPGKAKPHTIYRYVPYT